MKLRILFLREINLQVLTKNYYALLKKGFEEEIERNKHNNIDSDDDEDIYVQEII